MSQSSPGLDQVLDRRVDVVDLERLRDDEIDVVTRFAHLLDENEAVEPLGVL